jgi:predicted HicB family RNase H-like nuclease
MSRTALLIRCTTEEAGRIRIEADKQRRTISAYVLQIMARAVEVEDRLFASMNRYSTLNQALSRRAAIAPGPRTAILVRCEDTEADRIREAAHRRDIAINAFVLQALTRAWNVQMAPPAGVTATTAPSQATPVA